MNKILINTAAFIVTSTVAFFAAKTHLKRVKEKEKEIEKEMGS
jgi:hypothetical protein